MVFGVGILIGAVLGGSTVGLLVCALVGGAREQERRDAYREGWDNAQAAYEVMAVERQAKPAAERPAERAAQRQPLTGSECVDATQVPGLGMERQTG